MPITVDARGLACPQPVILTRNAMRESDQVTTLVSAPDQVENVRRLAERAGWVVTVTPAEPGHAIHMTKGHAPREPEVTPDIAVCAPGTGPGRVLVLASDQIGRGEAELGSILMRSFLYTLQQIEPRPDTLILMNAGVKLAVEAIPGTVRSASSAEQWPADPGVRHVPGLFPAQASHRRGHHLEHVHDRRDDSVCGAKYLSLVILLTPLEETTAWTPPHFDWST